MTTDAPVLTARRWRSRRSAAIAGIIFAVLLITALTMIRIALSESSLQALQTDAQRRSLIRFSLQLVPFAGIAFLWFIGVVRELLGNVEDRLFSTVFPGKRAALLGDAVHRRSQLDRPAGDARRTQRERGPFRIRSQ